MGRRTEETKRYQLGELLGGITRHFLLMTATPHNGKEEDFQLFLGLLDRDRFEGRSARRDDEVDTSDLMRRMEKENLRRFDGRPLFPERRAYTVNYPLSPGERRSTRPSPTTCATSSTAPRSCTIDRRGTVGFALTVLQRRLASSPEAIYQSLQAPPRAAARTAGRTQRPDGSSGKTPALRTDRRRSLPVLFDDAFWDDFDDAPAEEAEDLEEQILDSATAALTAGELEAEIETLTGLERLAYEVRHSGTDHKWVELATLLQDRRAHGRRKRPPPQAGHLHRAPRHAALSAREDHPALRS